MLSSLKSRYLRQAILEDAFPKHKLIFISGPRQVGKTTLAKSLAPNSDNYFSYDDERFRRAWAKNPSSAIESRGPGAFTLDEIHKDRLWKRKLKGFYDLDPNAGPIIVTGSSRLDLYRKGSDSLMGRYLPYRLHPISVGESKSAPMPDSVFEGKEVHTTTVKELLHLGGFPEPLVGANEKEAKRWSRLRLDRLVQEDTRDVLGVSDLRAFGVLADLLPERIGSLLSINSLREDVGKAYATVRSWYHVLETLYFCFSIKPYSKKIARAIRSEPKMYLYDLLRIPEPNMGQRLENLTALHLIKACHYWTDCAFGEFSLHFVRDKQGREVDFLIVRDNKPWMLVECKSGEKSPSPHLKYFGDLLTPDHRIQLITDPKYERSYPALKTRILGYDKFFSKLP
jgi:uncharacterized protein